MSSSDIEPVIVSIAKQKAPRPPTLQRIYWVVGIAVAILPLAGLFPRIRDPLIVTSLITGLLAGIRIWRYNPEEYLAEQLVEVSRIRFKISQAFHVLSFNPSILRQLDDDVLIKSRVALMKYSSILWMVYQLALFFEKDLVADKLRHEIEVLNLISTQIATEILARPSLTRRSSFEP